MPKPRRTDQEVHFSRRRRPRLCHHQKCSAFLLTSRRWEQTTGPKDVLCRLYMTIEGSDRHTANENEVQPSTQLIPCPPREQTEGHTRLFNPSPVGSASESPTRVCAAAFRELAFSFHVTNPVEPVAALPGGPPQPGARKPSTPRPVQGEVSPQMTHTGCLPAIPGFAIHKLRDLGPGS